MIMKKTLSLLLAVIMIAMTFTVFPITANAADVDAAGTEEGTVKYVGTADELKAACNEINTNGGNYTINLTADIQDGYIGITNSTAEVTVFGNNHEMDCSRIYGGAIYVSNGATVSLGSRDGGEKNKLTVSGGKDNDNPGLVYVLADSTCNMYDGVTLQDHEGQNYFGGGVTIEGGTFHMYGGTIRKCGINGGSVCYGGGVAVFNGGTFIMDGGTITECYVTTDYISQSDDFPPFVDDPENAITAVGGGVYVSSGSVFTMNGGTISKNTAYNSANIAAYGGGVAVVASEGYGNYTEKLLGGGIQSAVTINGGMITENSADNGAGLYASEEHFTFAAAFGASNWRVILNSNIDPGLFINGGVITKNNAAAEGGGVYLESIVDVSENNGYHRAEVVFNGATITENTSGDRGAGVYYNEIVKLWLSGANIIQGNTYNDKLNNLNIYKADDTVYPVYVDGDLTGSQIGLSDPKLWDDDLSDEADEAVSEDYLTSGYKNNNDANPSAYFTSDHETWMADFSNVKEDEVRLVRKTKVDYHINNDDIIAAKYDDNNDETDDDIFTDEIEAAGTTVNVGDTINEFYTIPEVVPTADNSCPYIFKGWYYDQDNEDDDDPVVFGADVYTARRDIYAHWIKVENVRKHWSDENVLPPGVKSYGGFDLAGVQIRRSMLDTNFGKITPGGMRFITSLSMDVVNEINKIKPNNIEYGYVAAKYDGTSKDWIDYHDGYEKLQYVSDGANGINTTNTTDKDKDYFGFAHNVDCTSCVANSSSTIVPLDHQNYDGYLLYSLVINYDEENPKGYETKVLARPYIHYTDANNLDRVAYSEYLGNANKIGGCYISYNDIAAPSGN